MTSMFDYDDSVNLAFEAKTAGKNLIQAKHEVLTRTGDFLFLAHSDREFAYRCQMVDNEIESSAGRKMSSVSDSKAKLVRALYEEWNLRHASCQTCKVASYPTCKGPECNNPLTPEVTNRKGKPLFCGPECESNYNRTPASQVTRSASRLKCSVEGCKEISLKGQNDLNTGSTLCGKHYDEQDNGKYKGPRIPGGM